MIPGSLVTVTGSTFDSSEPDTVCWPGSAEPDYENLFTITKGTTGIVLAAAGDKLQLLTDEASTIWLWADSVVPAG